MKNAELARCTNCGHEIYRYHKAAIPLQQGIWFHAHSLSSGCDDRTSFASPGAVIEEEPW